MASSISTTPCRGWRSPGSRRRARRRRKAAPEEAPVPQRPLSETEQSRLRAEIQLVATRAVSLLLAARGWSQTEAARRCGWDDSYRISNSLERRTGWTLEKLAILSTAAGINVADLLRLAYDSIDWEMRPFDIVQARSLAETAVMVSQARVNATGLELGPEEASQVRSEERELLALCLTRHDNAWRVTGDYYEANPLMETADRYLGEFPSAKALAGYELLRGPLLIEQGQRDAGRAALENAARLYAEDLDDEHMAGRTELQIAKMHRDYGESGQGSVDLIRRAIGKIDPIRDPALARAAQLNLSLHLLDSRDVAEAERAWLRVPPFESPVRDLQRVGIGGVIDLHAHRLENAEEILRMVMEKALAMNHGYLSVYTMLYLAIVLLESKRHSECIELLKQIIYVYHNRRWHRQDLLAAVRILEKTIDTQAVRRCTIENAIKQMTTRRPKKDPGLSTRLRA